MRKLSCLLVLVGLASASTTLLAIPSAGLSNKTLGVSPVPVVVPKFETQVASGQYARYNNRTEQGQREHVAASQAKASAAVVLQGEECKGQTTKATGRYCYTSTQKGDVVYWSLWRS